MNSKRLAVSVAVVAGVLYPVWTGSWSKFGTAIDAFWSSRRHDAEDIALAKGGTTRAEYRAQMNKAHQDCLRVGPTDAERSGSLFPQEEHEAGCRASSQIAIVLGPEESARSYGVGAVAALKQLLPWFADAFGSAALAFVLMLLAPNIAGRYYRWLQAE